MTEREVKLAIADVQRLRRKLRSLGWSGSRRRLEQNFVYDRAGLELSKSGRLLRIRTVGKQGWLTVKHPPQVGEKHKVREELEIELSDVATALRIFQGLGFVPIWRYEKYRASFSRPRVPGKIVLDQTPIGDYLELEGSARWIDRTAGALGYSETDYITASYRDLFLEARARDESIGPDMVFP